MAREHGRATIDPREPRALGICQRCGSMVNHDQLRWQYQWGGLRLLNLRILVCESCEDTPQIQLRTLILPPDPVPIEFAVPEDYTVTDNPISRIGFSLRPNGASGFGATFGTLTFGGGVDKAFDAKLNKFSWESAGAAISNSSFGNVIGKNWNAPISGNSIPPSITTTITYSVSSFSVYAPSDKPIIPIGSVTTNMGQAFDSGAFDSGTFDTVLNSATVMGAGNIQLQGSNDGLAWTVLYSSTILGTVGEVFTSLSSNLTTGNFQQHRVAITGDGVNPMYVAQVQLNVFNTGQNEQ